MALAKDELALDTFPEEDESALTKNDKENRNIIERATRPVNWNNDDRVILDTRIVDSGE